MKLASYGWVVLLALFGSEADAQRRIAPGSPVDLKPGEGLVVTVVDTNTIVASVRFRKVGNALSAPPLKPGGTSRSFELFAAPAGDYGWERIELHFYGGSRVHYDFFDDASYRFKVSANRINYAGDLMFRAVGARSASVRMVNRSLAVWDWLRVTHPGAFAKFDVAYSGEFPDPFPAVYQQALRTAKTLSQDLDNGRVPPEPSALPIAPKLMWTPAKVLDVSLNADGTLVVIEKSTASGGSALELVDMQSGTSQMLASSPGGFGTLEWKDGLSLLATSYASGIGTLRVFRIGAAEAGRRRIIKLDGPSGGSVVDLLPQSKDRILYQAFNPDGALVVHTLGIANQREIGAFRKRANRDRLNRGVEGDRAWLADGSGELRTALALKDQEVVLYHGADGVFRPVMRFDHSSRFTPLQLSADGERLFGLDDSGRAQRDLVELDLSSGRITRTLFTKPGVDVTAAAFDARREPIGATYYEDGRPVSEYFDAAESSSLALIARSLRGRSVVPIRRSRDGRRSVLWVDSSDKPPELYYLDLDKGQAERLDSLFPHLGQLQFVPSRLVQVARGQQHSIQAFLTLPPGEGRRPLVVMPHGGPIGIADRLHFDREVQFIASLGFAVLQVNFRGSEGYGRAFREAGERQFGTGIEEDIDAAIETVLASEPLDRARMCIMGTSYGGYSALISAIRWPTRFRCAISIAGVTDRLLLFTASDTADSAAGRTELIRRMGDPRSEGDALRALSPLYQYEELQTPTMVVHGRLDARVDFEHARRLVRMLALDGRKPVVMAFPDEAHGIVDPAAQAVLWTGIAGFLQENLRSGSTLNTKKPLARCCASTGSRPTFAEGFGDLAR